MGTRQPFDERCATSKNRPSVTVEMEGQSSETGRLGTVPLEPTVGASSAVRALAVAALVSLSVLVVLTVGMSRDVGGQGAASTTTVPNVGESDVVERVEQAPVTAVPIIDQLPTTPDALLDGLVIAWVDDVRQLQLQRLGDGEALDVSRLARTNIPPLPERVYLIGAENSTWLIDLEVPENSGELSNTVRMVRLGQDLDSYAFISSNEGADTEFFVGSLWGPAATGTATAPASAAVLTVPRRGVVVATQAAQSSVLFGDGLERLPTRLGRIVAAGKSLVVGIFCDDLGRCIGRVANWDGSNEREIRADALGSPVVRISPDERFIVTTGGETWTVYDLWEGSVSSWTSALLPNETLSWAPDSTSVFWVDDGLLVHQVIDGGRRGALSVVRQVGSLGEPLAQSDVIVLETS